MIVIEVEIEVEVELKSERVSAGGTDRKPFGTVVVWLCFFFSKLWCHGVPCRTSRSRKGDGVEDEDGNFAGRVVQDVAFPEMACIVQLWLRTLAQLQCC